MPFIVPPGRNKIVAEAFALKEAAERREKRIANTYRTKPLSAAPAAEPKKNAKPSRAKGGKPSKRKP